MPRLARVNTPLLDAIASWLLYRENDGCAAGILLNYRYGATLFLQYVRGNHLSPYAEERLVAMCSSMRSRALKHRTVESIADPPPALLWDTPPDVGLADRGIQQLKGVPAEWRVSSGRAAVLGRLRSLGRVQYRPPSRPSLRRRP